MFAALSFEALSLFHLRRVSSLTEVRRWIEPIPHLPWVARGSLLLVFLSGVYLTVRMEAFELAWPKVAVGALLLIAPLGALMSWGPSATNASTGELQMYDKQVYDFWFPQGLENAEPETFRRQVEWWFAGGANAELPPFTHTLMAARLGRLEHWLATPRGRLALIIVLDQFPRGLFAGKAEAYASDPQALRIAEEGLWNGHYDALTQPWEKTFFFLPMGHAEGPGHLHRLDRVVALAENVTLDAPERFRMYYQFSLSQARANRDLIARFGRFPHRNDILGRASTPEEAEYVKTGHFVHLRRPPAERMPVAAE